MLENRNFCRFFVFLAARKAKSSWLHYDVKIDVTSGPAFWLVDLNQHPNVNSGESSRRNDDWRKKHQESKKQQRRLPVQSSSFFCEQTFLTSDLGWRLPFLPACFGVRPRVESRRPFAYLLVNDRSFLCRPLSSFTQPQKLQYNYTTLLYATLHYAMSHSHSELYQQASDAQRYLESNLPPELQRPKFAIICGSGLGGLSDTVDDKAKAEFQYADIPHFPLSTGTYVLRWREEGEEEKTVVTHNTDGAPPGLLFGGCLVSCGEGSLLLLRCPVPLFR